MPGSTTTSGGAASNRIAGTGIAMWTSTCARAGRENSEHATARRIRVRMAALSTAGPPGSLPRRSDPIEDCSGGSREAVRVHRRLERAQARDLLERGPAPVVVEVV